jgi:hypothetical protein
MSSAFHPRAAPSIPYIFRTEFAHPPPLLEAHAARSGKGKPMARTVRNPKIDTRSARAKLPARREPHWIMLSQGCALGYHKGAKGGTWIARFRDDDGRQHYEAIGAADDARDPDGLSVFGFAQAQERARAWLNRKARELTGDFAPLDRPYTVADALANYRGDYLRRGGKAIVALDSAMSAWISPELGALPLDRLNKRRIVEWHQRSPMRHRGDVPSPAKRKGTARPITAPWQCAGAAPPQTGCSRF